MGETRWLSAPEAEAWRAYLDMGSGLEAVVARQLGSWGLSIPDYDVLARLSQSPGGPLRARELRESVGWDRSRLSHQLRRMEQRDLVRRSECAEDGRGTMIEITPAGRAAVEAAAPGHVRTVRHHLIDLPPRPRSPCCATSPSGSVPAWTTRSTTTAPRAGPESARHVMRRLRAVIDISVRGGVRDAAACTQALIMRVREGR